MNLSPRISRIDILASTYNDSRMVESVRDITNPLRLQLGRGYATPAQGSDDVGVFRCGGALAPAECKKRHGILRCFTHIDFTSGSGLKGLDRP